MWLTKKDKRDNNIIDFVITWVDGDDPEWRAEKHRYEKQAGFTNDNRDVRYRDFDLLRYWFRAVEQNASWVHKIHFVTWGHIPEWLNTSNPKIDIVRHSDFMPKKYLPTFSSTAIEMNLHRIKDLSEKFVYFNDDMFILNKTKPTDFFKNGLPCDTAIADAIVPFGKDMFEHRLVNNSNIVNKYYKIRTVIKKHPLQWFNFRYGAMQLFTLPMLMKQNFSTIKSFHLPTSLTKEWFKFLWQNEEAVMENTSIQKFRNITSVNPWLVQDLQIASGKFTPRSPKIGKNIPLDNDISSIQTLVEKSNYKLLCLNDSTQIKDFEATKKYLRRSFENRFPDKSSFEVR